MTKFGEYLEHGWRLVPIMPGQKGPRKKGWNRRENCINDAHYEMHSAGLAHAYSGTMALDVDDYPLAREWLAERGVDLDALFTSPGAVQIKSGRADHGKLLYAMVDPMASKQIKVDNKCILDFRCATASGLTVQDVLPPSVHPDTGNPYEWGYDDLLTHWSTPQLIPDELLAIWESELSVAPSDIDAKGVRSDLDELRTLLQQQDPDCNRDEWVRVGMAIHHETDGGTDGLSLWDEWSQGSDKYRGLQDLETVWRSFHDSPNAVTVGHLRQNTAATIDDFEIIDGEPLTDDPWAKAERDRAARFRLVSLGEIVQRDPPEWLVEKLLPETDLAMIYGAPGAGKSFVALDLGFAVAQGDTWFDRPSKMGTVVWIAAEAASEMRNRASAYGVANGVDITKIDFHVIEQTFSFMDGEDSKALIHAIKPVEPRLVIVDTLAAASGGANENSGEDMNKVLKACREMHDATGATIVLIHHSGKDASRGARGWSGLKAAMRAEFEVTHKIGSPLRVMSVTKQSAGIDGERFPFKLSAVDLNFDGDSSCVIDPMDPRVLDPDNKDPVRQSPRKELYKKTVFELLGEGVWADINDVRDRMSTQMPPPERNARDRRMELIRRTEEQLVISNSITLKDGKVRLGTEGDDDGAQELP